MEEFLLCRQLEVAADETLSAEQKKDRITVFFINAVSTNNVQTVNFLLSSSHQLHPFVKVNGKDSDGSTALIYAASFGYMDCCHILLRQPGIDVNCTDACGWTPLQWASSNGHEEICEMLRSKGGLSKSRTAAAEVATTTSTSLVEDEPSMIETDEASLSSSIASFSFKETLLDQTFYTAAGTTDDNDLSIHDDDGIASEDEDLDSVYYSKQKNQKFQWDKCNLDQVIVFSENKIPEILDFAITQVKPKSCVEENEWFETPTISSINFLSYTHPLSADVLFLCMRYAHYFHTEEFLSDFFDCVIECIINAVEKNKGDLDLIAYWIANATQLLYYFKKDAGLVGSAFDVQLKLSELVQDLSSIFVKNMYDLRIEGVLDSAFLNYSAQDEAEGRTEQEAPVFEGLFSGKMSRRRTLLKSVSQAKLRNNSINNTARLFNRIASSATGTISTNNAPSTSSTTMEDAVIGRRNTASSSSSAASAATSIPQYPYVSSPRDITTLLSEGMTSLSKFKVHAAIQSHIYNHMFHTLGAELFNLILLSPHGLCCRSKGVQIRMNLLVLEEWIQENGSILSPVTATTIPPPSLSRHLKHVIHLTHFLQAISSVEDLTGFIETMRSLDGFTLSQARLAMQNYKYEVGEESFPEEVEFYVQNCIEGVVQFEKEKSRGDCGGGEMDEQDSLLKENIEVWYPPLKLPVLIGCPTLERFEPEALVEILDITNN